jgi:predicted Zn-dependent peptidase
MLNVRSTPSSHVTTRVSGVGSRYDRVGGESAMLARAVDGGKVCRECVSFPSLPSLDVSDISAMRSGLISEIEGMSQDAVVMDRLHETAYQTSSVGNSLGSPLSGTSETVSSLTVADVRGLLSNVRGEDVVVVGTGSGEHDKLVDDVIKAYGTLPSSSGGGGGGKGKAVVKAGEKSSFIGSDVR